MIVGLKLSFYKVQNWKYWCAFLHGFFRFSTIPLLLTHTISLFTEWYSYWCNCFFINKIIKTRARAAVMGCDHYSSSKFQISVFYHKVPLFYVFSITLLKWNQHGIKTVDKFHVKKYHWPTSLSLPSLTYQMNPGASKSNMSFLDVTCYKHGAAFYHI